MSQHTHKERAPASIGLALLTISDTRTMADDASGAMAHEMFGRAGHDVRDYRILKDEPEEVRSAILELAARTDVRAIVLSGGTGISRRDQTYEVVSALLDRRLDGFGEIFRALSYQEIGPAAMLSRAVAGLVGNTVIFALPGSSSAVRLALEELILPEIGHLVAEIDKQPGETPAHPRE